MRGGRGSSKVFQLFRDTHAKSGVDLDRMTRGKLSQAVDMIRYGLGEVGMTPSEVHAVLNGPIAIGIGRPSLHSLMTPSVLMALDTRGREGKVEAVLRKLEAMLPQAIRNLDRMKPRWTSLRIGDARVRRLEFESIGFRVHYATQNGFLLIGTGQGYLESALDVLAGKAKGIQRHPTVAKGREQLGGAPLMSAFLNTTPMMKAIEPSRRTTSKASATRSASATCAASGSARTMAGGASRDHFVLDLDGSPKGLMKALFSKPGTGLGAEYCAKDTGIFLNASIDIAAMQDALQRVLGHLPRELQDEFHHEMEREVVREIDREMDDFGMSHRDLHT